MMKRIGYWMIPFTLFANINVQAQEADQNIHQKHHPQGKGMMGGGMMGGGMMKMMANMSDEQKIIHIRMMQAHMLAIHDLSNQILAEQDPKKKQELKDKQVQLIKEHMEKMMNRHHKSKEHETAQ